MAKKKMTIHQLRNLPQYKGMSDKELLNVRRNILAGKPKERVEEILEDFAKDYDLSDLNANDQLSLTNLAQIFVRLEQVDKQLDIAMVDAEDMTRVDKLTRVAGSLRKDASQIQQDLSITRKARKSDKEESIITYIEDIKARAKKQLKDRLNYVYCEKCRMLLCNAWFLYPESNNSISLTCTRIVDGDSGEICGHVTRVSSLELKENSNRNIEDTLPV